MRPEFADDPRVGHNRRERVCFQQSSPIDNWRRLIACRVGPGHYCSDTTRYFVSDAAPYDLDALLVLFNSGVTEHRFGLTSTNNHVNA